jgi:hypothetical protein
MDEMKDGYKEIPNYNEDGSDYEDVEDYAELS